MASTTAIILSIFYHTDNKHIISIWIINSKAIKPTLMYHFECLYLNFLVLLFLFFRLLWLLILSYHLLFLLDFLQLVLNHFLLCLQFLLWIHLVFKISVFPFSYSIYGFYHTSIICKSWVYWCHMYWIY